MAPEPQFIEEAPALDGTQLRDDLRVLAPAPVPAADELVVAATIEEADARALVPDAHYAEQNNENNAIAPDLFLRACTICLLNRPNMIVLPCGHLIMCGPCSEEHERRRYMMFFNNFPDLTLSFPNLIPLWYFLVQIGIPMFCY